jgi:hypothetical protein
VPPEETPKVPEIFESVLVAVAYTFPVESIARELGPVSPVKYVFPELVNRVVLACENSAVEEAKRENVVPLSQRGVEVETTFVEKLESCVNGQPKESLLLKVVQSVPERRP